MAVQVAGITDDWISTKPNKKVVTTGADFDAMERRLRASGTLIFDFETSGTAWHQHSCACGIALGCFDEQGQVLAWYVPYRHQTGEDQLSLSLIHPAIGSLLENESTLKIAHNFKFDEHMARKDGWRVRGERYDTMVAARLYNENILIGLKHRASVDLNRSEEARYEKKMDLFVRRDAKSMGLGKQEYMNIYGYARVPIQLCGTYACYDIDFTGELFKFYEQWGMRAKHPRIWPNEMALTEVICDCEENGLPIDTDYLELLRDSLGGQLAALEEKIDGILGRSINLGSDAAIRSLLYGRGPGEMGLTVFKETKGRKPAVDREVLEHYAASSKLLRLIMEWRDADKIVSTYTTSILDRLDSHNILHGELLQAGTDTGRLASKNPNLQNFPSDDDDRAVAFSGKKLEHGGVDPWSVKRAFINRGSDWVRLLFDYSQVELRVLAFYSRDPIMVDTYLKNEDIHRRTSLEVFGTADKDKRRKAKVVNFGLSYCLSAKGLSRQAKMPLMEAEAFMEKFFERYAGIVTFRQDFWQRVSANAGVFQNMFGRYRRLPAVNSYDKYDSERAKRQAIGSLIQGTAAELTKESMVKVYRWLKAEKIPALMVTTIHDEIQVDVPVDYLPQVAQGMKSIMEHYPEFDPIPIVVDGSYFNTNWAEKKKLPL